jgi:hypothetical protein
VIDPELISEAIVIWTGDGRTAWPARDERLLVEHFGDAAVDLLPRVKELARGFDESDAIHWIGDLSEATDQAESEFRSNHPELSKEAVEALAWRYSYHNR